MKEEDRLRAELAETKAKLKETQDRLNHLAGEMKSQLNRLTDEHGKLTDFEAELVRLMQVELKIRASLPLYGDSTLNEEVKKEKPLLTANHARSIHQHKIDLYDMRTDALLFASRYTRFRDALEVLLEKCPPIESKIIREFGKITTK